MAPERRQAFRRDPIEIDLEDRVISVGPVPWEDRNSIGNSIIRQHTEELNEAVRLYTDPETQAPQLEARLANKLKDPLVILSLGLGPEEYRRATEKPLFSNQITELLLAILEVNELKHLQALVDPNFETPAGIGGIISTLMDAGEDSQKTQSGPDSSSEALKEKASEDSPIPSLIAS